MTLNAKPMAAACLRLSLSLPLAATFAACVAGSAGAAQVTLPITTPPKDATPDIAQYLEICSAGMKNVPEAGKIAMAKGWKIPKADQSGMAGGAAASGMFTATKGDGSFVTITRVPFPHVTATSCQMVLSKKPQDFDPAVMTQIDGVVGGAPMPGLAGNKASLWSFVDDTGQVVTMTAIPAGGTRFVLTMGRAELTKLGKDAGAKPAG
ncbi:hypothetical protein LQ948_12675 [Jiella sp. MQZ9-1]|uniref:Uncharacterized protein n=1 Tax=Jiella flava TaxID=2816857 RepID=A0A939G0B7_9HYPH|nr:hypothetical protein [Jiella flava]MBO0663490.1 hypothetical protein [Jiella flava]MCD2472065.1 hypothetical protein [Jiella flava]